MIATKFFRGVFYGVLVGIAVLIIAGTAPHIAECFAAGALISFALEEMRKLAA